MGYDVRREYLDIIAGKICVRDFMGALENVNRLLGYDPEFAEAHYFRGICNYSLENYPESVRDYQKALKYEPNHAKARFNLGVSRYAQGLLEEALFNVIVAYQIFKKNDDQSGMEKCRETAEALKSEMGGVVDIAELGGLTP